MRAPLNEKKKPIGRGGETGLRQERKKALSKKKMLGFLKLWVAQRIGGGSNNRTVSTELL